MLLIQGCICCHLHLPNSYPIRRLCLALNTRDTTSFILIKQLGNFWTIQWVRSQEVKQNILFLPGQNDFLWAKQLSPAQDSLE